MPPSPAHLLICLPPTDSDSLFCVERKLQRMVDCLLQSWDVITWPRLGTETRWRNVSDRRVSGSFTTPTLQVDWTHSFEQKLSRLNQTIQWSANYFAGSFSSRPNLDHFSQFPSLVPADPVALLTDGNFSKVPILVGSNSGEGILNAGDYINKCEKLFINSRQLCHYQAGAAGLGVQWCDSLGRDPR